MNSLMIIFIFSIALDIQIIVPETQRSSGGRINKLKIGRSSLEYAVIKALIHTTGKASELAHASPELQASQMWVFVHRSPTFQLDTGHWKYCLLVCVMESQNHRTLEVEGTS